MLLDIWEPKDDAPLFPNVVNYFTATRHRATRLAFTDEVVEEVGHMLRDYPNKLINNLPLISPPYETTYLEFDLELLIKSIGAGSSIDTKPPGSVADKTVGLMVHKGQLAALVRGTTGGYPHVSPVFYTINGTEPESKNFFKIVIYGEEDKHNDAAQNSKLALILGSTFTHQKLALTDEHADSLMRRVTPYMDLEFIKTLKQQELKSTVLDFLSGSIGEVRNLWALLMWFGQSKVTSAQQVPASRAWVGGKSKAFARHNVIRLRDTYHANLINRYFPSTRKVGEHDVGTFMRHFDKDPHCDHEWPLLPNERGHFHCRKCTQWCTRVREHKRGDPNLGTITKEYVV